MTLSSEIGWAGLVRRGPSIVRRLRLASGLVLFTYVFLHFINHSLGNISLEAMEQRRGGPGMDLARPDRYRRALRRLRDPPPARLLGALQPPQPADGLDRGHPAWSRIPDTDITAATCARRTLRLQLFRLSSDLPERAVFLLGCGTV